MKTLFILNGAPYGDERTYNGLRLAGALAARPDHTVHVFLMGDAAAAAKSGQQVPSGYYNIQVMLSKVLRDGRASVAACGTCLDARGIKAEELAPDVQRGTLEQLADWTGWADKTLVF